MLLISALLVAAWWCFHFPYDVRRVYRAIPSNFIALSRHGNLAERWGEIIEHPVTAVGADAIGLTRDDLAALRRSPEIDRLVRWLGPRESVFAYLPALGDTGKPAWIASSWVGDRGRILEFNAARGQFPGLERVVANRRVAIYSMRLQDSLLGEHLSMAVVEGVWLACLSDQAQAVTCLVDRVESGAMLVEQLVSGGGEGERAGERAGAPDQFWLRWFDPVPRGSRLREMFIDLRDIANGSLKGWARGELGSLPRPRLSQMDGLEQLPGGAPQALVLLPAAGVQPWLTRLGLPRDILTVLAQVSGQSLPESPLALALYGDGYSGKMFGIRAPALVCAWRTREPAELSAQTAEALDYLNARYGWTLIPRSVMLGDHPCVAIDTTADGVYASLRDDEKAGLTAIGDWVLFSSNMKTLERLLDDGTRQRVAESYDRALRQAREDGVPAETASLFAECDLSAAAMTLRNAVAVYTLMLIAQPNAGGGITRENLSEARRWLMRLDGLGDCTLWLRNRGPEVEIEFTLAPRSPEL